MTEKNTIIRKFVLLFKGEQPFPKRLLLSAGPAFALSFMLFFFGPVDLAYISRNDISYSPLYILPVTGLIMGIVFLLLLLAAAIPGGKIHAILVSIYTGCSFAMYLQGAFMNPDLGTLDGHTINWTGLSKDMCLNLTLWTIILLIPFLIHYLSNRFWRRFTTFISIMLILMQSVSLITKIMDQVQFDKSNPPNYYLSKKDMFLLGKQKNVIVFLLDTVSNRDIELTAEKYPDILPQFKDFTCFDNANTQYMFTFPSLLDMLTRHDPVITAFDHQKYIEEAWLSPAAVAFYTELRKNDFQTNFYVMAYELTQNLGSLQPYISNIQLYGNNYKIDRSALLNLYKLSLYRYLPIAAKPFFYLYSEDVSQVIVNPDALYDMDDFVREFPNIELEIGNQENIFNLIHLQGSHLPYYMNEKGAIVGTWGHRRSSTNMTDQVAGQLRLIGLYLWEMKANEVYDDSLIIIQADHGTNVDLTYDPQPFFWIKMPDSLNDSMNISHAPITIQTDFIPTIARTLGFSDYDYGRTVFEIEDAPRERITRVFSGNKDFLSSGSKDTALFEFHYVGNREDLMEAFTKAPAGIYPITGNDE